MARLLADEDFDHRMAARLRVIGHDVLTLALLGLAGCRFPDDQVLTAATGEGRAILTHNRLHFIRLHRHTQSMLASYQQPITRPAGSS